MKLLNTLLLTLMAALLAVAQPAGEFIHYPYLQHPTRDGMTIIWWTADDTPGILTYGVGELTAAVESVPVRTPEVANRYRHEIRLSDLKTGTLYEYAVTQGQETFRSRFRTAPAGDVSIRFVVLGDSETEPPEPGGRAGDRREPIQAIVGDEILSAPYPLTHNEGFQANLAGILTRNPDFLVIAGDLVESGGEQQDWDRFFSDVGSPDPALNFAGRIPILPALGNHEYYEGPGPEMMGYDQPGSERAVAKYLAYFDMPSNGALSAFQRERYYRLDYGPATLIVLDTNNQSPHQSEHDTNWYLLGENDPEGGDAPDWAPGSRQYEWLEAQLTHAQAHSMFTFVVFHQAPFSAGPHGWPPGDRPPNNPLSGVPVRQLDDLFHRYGVDAVFSGHDEILERSETVGVERTADGPVQYVLHYYDVGIAGDGLRGPQEGLENPFRKFLAMNSAVGRHYGFLEVNIERENGNWRATLTPYWINPITRRIGGIWDDIILLTAQAKPRHGALGDSTTYVLARVYGKGEEKVP